MLRNFYLFFFLLPKSKAEFDQQVGFVPGFASCRYRSQESKRSERSLFFSPSDVDEAVIESQKYIRFVFTDTSRYVVFTSTPDGAYPAA